MPSRPHLETGSTRSFAKPQVRGLPQPLHGAVAAAAGSEIHDACMDDGSWGDRIGRALDDDGFVLYAQRVSPVSREPQGMHAEVVLRMAGRDRTPIPAAAFLPSAERLQLSSRIDCWVLDRVIADMRAAETLDVLELLSVNLSAQSVGDHACHRHIVRILEMAGPDICRRLCLEMTEADVLRHFADAAQLVKPLRALGVRVALDRFGAGGGDLDYLRNISIDFLKIDGQVIRAVLDGAAGEFAVRRIVHAARLTGAKTVATSVDKPELLERVFRIGVDFTQGFFVYRPAPINELLEVPLWQLVPMER